MDLITAQNLRDSRASVLTTQQSYQAAVTNFARQQSELYEDLRKNSERKIAQKQAIVDTQTDALKTRERQLAEATDGWNAANRLLCKSEKDRDALDTASKKKDAQIEALNNKVNELKIASMTSKYEIQDLVHTLQVTAWELAATQYLAEETAAQLDQQTAARIMTKKKNNLLSKQKSGWRSAYLHERQQMEGLFQRISDMSWEEADCDIEYADSDSDD